MHSPSSNIRVNMYACTNLIQNVRPVYLPLSTPTSFPVDYILKFRVRAHAN